MRRAPERLTGFMTDRTHLSDPSSRGASRLRRASKDERPPPLNPAPASGPSPFEARPIARQDMRAETPVFAGLCRERAFAGLAPQGDGTNSCARQSTPTTESRLHAHHIFTPLSAKY